MVFISVASRFMELHSAALLPERSPNGRADTLAQDLPRIISPIDRLRRLVELLRRQILTEGVGFEPTAFSEHLGRISSPGVDGIEGIKNIDDVLTGVLTFRRQMASLW